MEVVIMRGIPGSGKSTYIAKQFPHATVVSADHFFIDSNGVYRYRAEDIRRAHWHCFRQFLQALERGDECIVVDNTSITPPDISPLLSRRRILWVSRANYHRAS